MSDNCDKYFNNPFQILISNALEYLPIKSFAKTFHSILNWSQPVGSWCLCFTYILLMSLSYILLLQCKGYTWPLLIGSAGIHCEFVCRQNIWKMHKMVSFFVEIAIASRKADWFFRSPIQIQPISYQSSLQRKYFSEPHLRFANIFWYSTHFTIAVPEAVLPVVSSDMGAVHHSCKVVGAPLLPVPNALGLLSVRLWALDVNTGLVTQHQLGLVCNCENMNKSCAIFCFIHF